VQSVADTREERVNLPTKLEVRLIDPLQTSREMRSPATSSSIEYARWFGVSLFGAPLWSSDDPLQLLFQASLRKCSLNISLSFDLGGGVLRNRDTIRHK
jgi:hypothetical protein